MIITKKINDNQISYLISINELSSRNIQARDLISGEGAAEEFVEFIVNTAIDKYDIDIEDKELFLSLLDADERFISLMLTSVGVDELKDYENNFIDFINEYVSELQGSPAEEIFTDAGADPKVIAYFRFDRLDNVCDMSKKTDFPGLVDTTLFRDPRTDDYLLFLSIPFQTENLEEIFTKACNYCSEYCGQALLYNIEFNEATESYLKEKSTIIIDDFVKKMADV